MAWGEVVAVDIAAPADMLCPCPQEATCAIAGPLPGLLLSAVW